MYSLTQRPSEDGTKVNTAWLRDAQAKRALSILWDSAIETFIPPEAQGEHCLRPEVQK